MSQVKYRHPANPDLTWTGRGRTPKWVEAYQANGGSLISLDAELQDRDNQNLKSAGVDLEVIEQGIDLGIGEPAQPSLGATLYAQRIVAGHSEMPEAVDGELQLAIGIATEKTGVRPADSTELVAQPEASQQQLEVCLREFGFQALTMEEFIQVGIDELNQATIRACRAGVAFWAAQEAVKNTECAGRTQEFKDWISEAGLTKERVYECIRIAKFYARLPEMMRAKALTIGKKNALLLASLPQEVIDQAAESGNDLIQKADMMTVAQLREEIRQLQRREKNYEAELERAKSQVSRLTEAKKRTTDFLLRTEEIREECMALQLGAELPINSLKKLFDDVNGEDSGLPEWRIQLEQIWVTAHVIAARAFDLVDALKQNIQIDAHPAMPERVMGTHILSPAEAERWLLDYPLIENRHAAEQAMRQQRRADDKPAGPGRPKGSKNKAAGE